MGTIIVLFPKITTDVFAISAVRATPSIKPQSVILDGTFHLDLARFAKKILNEYLQTTNTFFTSFFYGDHFFTDMGDVKNPTQLKF